MTIVTNWTEEGSNDLPVGGLLEPTIGFLLEPGVGFLFGGGLKTERDEESVAVSTTWTEE